MEEVKFDLMDFCQIFHAVTFKIAFDVGSIAPRLNKQICKTNKKNCLTKKYVRRKKILKINKRETTLILVISISFEF